MTKAHQPHQTCSISNSPLKSPGFFETTAAEREGCWGVPVSSGLLSLFEQVTATLTFIVPAETCWPLPVAYGTKVLFVISCALCCVLEGPCWGVPMSLVQWGHQIVGASSPHRCQGGKWKPTGPSTQSHEDIQVTRSYSNVSLVAAVLKAWGGWEMQIQRRMRLLGSCLSHWGEREQRRRTADAVELTALPAREDAPSGVTTQNNRMVWAERDLWRSSSPTPLQWPETTSTRSG